MALSLRPFAPLRGLSCRAPQRLSPRCIRDRVSMWQFRATQAGRPEGLEMISQLGSQASYVAGLIALGVCLAIPVLPLCAFRGWLRFQRNELPPWRNILGLASILVTLLDWVVLMALTLFAVIRFHTPLSSPDLNSGFVIVSLASAALSLALKRTPKLLIVVASALMAALWMTSTVR